MEILSSIKSFTQIVDLFTNFEQIKPIISLLTDDNFYNKPSTDSTRSFNKICDQLMAITVKLSEDFPQEAAQYAKIIKDIVISNQFDIAKIQNSNMGWEYEDNLNYIYLYLKNLKGVFFQSDQSTTISSSQSKIQINRIIIPYDKKDFLTLQIQSYTLSFFNLLHPSNVQRRMIQIN